MRVLVVVAAGSEEIETVNIVDTLRRAAFDVVLAKIPSPSTSSSSTSLTSTDLAVVCSRSTCLVADRLFDEDLAAESFDCIAVPGGLPGAHNIAASALFVQTLRQQKVSGKLYAAICAAPALVLGANGLLPGCATGHPSFPPECPKPSEDRVVVSENCITSRGPGTAIEFALAIIEQLAGKEKAQQVAAPMMMK